jgi:ABC-type polysaccharide/polyol phosphate export permease
MNDSGEKDSESIETKVINKVSETVAEAVRKLPAESGDVINFLADVIAGALLWYLWSEQLLAKDQVLLSFVIILAFLILCFIGTLLMRLADKPEKPT